MRNLQLVKTEKDIKDTNRPTRGQLERVVSQRLQALYRETLGHQPGNIICQLFDQTLALVIENSITPPEKLLANNGHLDLAEQVHSDLYKTIKPQIKQLLEDILQVSVIDLLSDATLETGRTGAIAILSATPQVRNPEAIPKAKKAALST